MKILTSCLGAAAVSPIFAALAAFAGGVDVVRRPGAARRARTLLCLPGALRTLTATSVRIGRLTQFNTRHPQLDIELPSGRLRLSGGVVRLATPLLALRARPRQRSTGSLQCQGRGMGCDAD